MRALTWWIGGAIIGAICWVPLPVSHAQSAPAAGDEITPLVEQGIAFLAQAQAADGSFSKESGTGITSLAATALLRHGRSAADPVVAQALAYLQQFVHEDGGIYQPNSLHRNYETCVALVCFQQANHDGRYTDLIKAGEAYIRQAQWDEDEGISRAEANYGGAGYGSHSRPDLSNTSFLIDTLEALGSADDDPAIQKALIFVSRCQNLPTKYNDTKFADLNPDGGFYYTIAAGGQSQAGTEDGGGLRSYGSMTYAGLRSMIFAGVNADDPRVQAAYQWVQKNYSLAENPGMADSGLYYYYHTFAKSLSAIGKPDLMDSTGTARRWRAELIRELGQRQQPDGSWVNANPRWLENDPNLVTSYALLALAYCR